MAFESSSIPKAIDGLVNLCQGMTVDGASVIVRDGPYGEFEMPHEQLILIIAEPPHGGAGGDAARGEQSFVTFPGRERDEEYDIFCSAIARSGDTDIRAERLRAFAILAEVEKRLRPGQPGADLTLGGSVLWAHICGDLTYQPAAAKGGTVVRIGFEVKCKARLDG